ncbi:hypothetical protein D3C84_944980 [compost metagenome]
MRFDQRIGIVGIDHENRAAIERIESYLNLGFLPPALIQLAQLGTVVFHGVVTNTLPTQRFFIGVITQTSIPELHRVWRWHHWMLPLQQLHGPCRRAAGFKAVLQPLKRGLHVHVRYPLDDQSLKLHDGVQTLLHRTTNGVTLQ